MHFCHNVHLQDTDSEVFLREYRVQAGCFKSHICLDAAQYAHALPLGDGLPLSGDDIALAGGPPPDVSTFPHLQLARNHSCANITSMAIGQSTLHVHDQSGRISFD